MTSIFTIFRFISEAFRLIKAFGALAVVVAVGIAGFLYSPFFESFFLGIVIGAIALFGLEFKNFDFFHAVKQAVHSTVISNNPMTYPNGDYIPFNP